MSLRPEQSTATAHGSRPRLRMRPVGAPPGPVHGAWWPRSADLAAQLETLLPELWDRLDGIEQVLYSPTTWPQAAPRMGVRGRLVRLVPSTVQAPNSIGLVGAVAGRVTTLLVIPVATPAEEAETVLSAAAAPAGSGIVSRFFRTGDGVSDHAGGSARAREAEEVHSAGERTGAARTVAGHAVDVEDCAMLLEMLGLDARGGSRDDGSGY